MQSQQGPSSHRHVLLVVFLFWMSLYMHIPYQAIFLISEGISKSSVGLVIGMYGIAQVVFRIPLGLISDKGGIHKPFLILGPAAIFASSIIRFNFGNGAGFLVANLLSGIAAATWVSYMVYFLNLFDEAESLKANSKIFSYNQAGVLVAFTVGAFSYDHVSMKGLNGISVLISLVAIVLSLRLKENTVNFKILEKPKNLEILKVVINSRLILFSLAAACIQGILLSTAFSFTGQIAKSLGANGLEIGICSLLNVLFSAVTAFLTSKNPFLRKNGYNNMLVLLVILFLYCVRMPNANSLIEVYILQSLAGIAGGFAYCYFTSEAIYGIQNKFKTTAMAMYQSIYAVGMTLLPILAGKLLDVYNMKIAYYAMSLFSILSMLFILLYRYINNKKKITLKIRGN